METWSPPWTVQAHTGVDGWRSESHYGTAFKGSRVSVVTVSVPKGGGRGGVRVGLEGTEVDLQV